jgi:glycosyltransferase involved in cell wall biosynthesis
VVAVGGGLHDETVDCHSVFNEASTIAGLRRVVEVDLEDLEKDIIVVDDGSTDGTRAAAVHKRHHADLSRSEQWQGAAIRTGLDYATGILSSCRMPT